MYTKYKALPTMLANACIATRSVTIYLQFTSGLSQLRVLSSHFMFVIWDFLHSPVLASRNFG